jgi:medium-chain acyl-[acyl-carrier-protein] hydrolase
MQRLSIDRQRPSGRSFVHVARPRPDAGVRLVCLPHTGSGGELFRSWSDDLGDSIEVAVLALPGRGRRIVETPIARAEDLLDAIEPEIAALADRPLALFGHSVGALEAVALAQRLLRRRLPLVRVFASAASPPPQTPLPIPQDDAELVRWLANVGGTPPEVLRSRELMQLMLPAVRADLMIYAELAPRAPVPLHVPLSVFGGRFDPLVAPEALRGWRRHAAGELDTRLFAGGHFYLADAAEAVVAAVRRELSSHLSRERVAS